MQGLRWIVTGMLLPGAMVAFAQTAVPTVQIAPPSAAVQAATGAVIGRVVGQDTQRAVRFAQVQLQSVESVRGGGGNFGGGQSNVRSDIDGTFVAEGLAPGDYYVTAIATGYISQMALLQAQVQAGGDATALLATLPEVHVAANATSNVTVTLERGGVVAGHVEWEDGSPAAGLSVQATPSSSTTLAPAFRGLGSFGGNTAFANTNDRGDFRLIGLATGDYVVSAVIQPGSNANGNARGGPALSPVRVYAPGVFRKPKAAVIGVRAGDERSDVRLVLDLRGMHAVAGAAVSASPGLAVASGRVTVIDPNDATLQISGAITPQGTFRLPYVPPGTYTLQVSGASTAANNNGFGRRGAGGPAAVSFQPFSQALVVGDADVSGVAVTLTPVAAAAGP